MAKIQALYRAWRREGDRVLWQAHSTTLRDDRSHGCSAVEVELLNRQYLQLTGTMDREAWAKRGAKRKSRQVGPPVSAPSPDVSLTLGGSMTANRRQALEAATCRARDQRGGALCRLATRSPCRSHCTNDGVNDPAVLPCR